jgi:hypothetical protein
MPQLHLGLNAPGLGIYKLAWRRDGIDPAGLATGAIDGFNPMFDVIEETTLRDHLGLPVPTW